MKPCYAFIPGEREREREKIYAYTPAQLARKLKCSPSSVSRCLAGKQKALRNGTVIREWRQPEQLKLFDQ